MDISILLSMHIQFQHCTEELGSITLRHKDFMITKMYGLFIDLFIQSVNIHECLHQANFYAWSKRYVSNLKDNVFGETGMKIDNYSLMQ